MKILIVKNDEVIEEYTFEDYIATNKEQFPKDSKATIKSLAIDDLFDDLRYQLEKQ